jgi:hypothetical protein
VFSGRALPLDSPRQAHTTVQVLEERVGAEGVPDRHPNVRHVAVALLVSLFQPLQGTILLSGEEIFQGEIPGRRPPRFPVARSLYVG